MKQKLWIITIVFFIALLILGKSTYSLFERSSDGNLESNIGNWVVKLNDFLISNVNETSFTITNFQYSENEHTASGYIAPGRTGYYDLILDATGTDVAVMFDITLGVEDEFAENVSMNVTVEDGQNIIRTGENTYSGVISLLDIQNSVYKILRINIEWLDMEEYDESDTEIGLNETEFSIPVTVKISQYLGETLIPYEEETE